MTPQSRVLVTAALSVLCFALNDVAAQRSRSAPPVETRTKDRLFPIPTYTPSKEQEGSRTTRRPASTSDAKAVIGRIEQRDDVFSAQSVGTSIWMADFHHRQSQMQGAISARVYDSVLKSHFKETHVAHYFQRSSLQA
ncbi:hypothetical protein [Massilia scottii]|uniref:hypothetical protein n=1 Tax=Massilia scottii TaxID=3057166 RepID=UPI0027968E3E|nr:hypothetical protein [Massilia sp. CCM 9029]MDQ1829428.1 hypothetical protein [Massilia sp. CCM 9029]